MLIWPPYWAGYGLAFAFAFSDAFIELAAGRGVFIVVRVFATRNHGGDRRATFCHYRLNRYLLEGVLPLPE